METRIDLVILAGGNSSRYGKYKQLEPVGPRNMPILSYTIADAIGMGISHIYIVGNSEIKQELRNLATIKQFNDRITVINKDDQHHLDSLNKKCDSYYGVGYALWCCKGLLNNSFLLVNADDFYGRGALNEVFKNIKDSDEDQAYMAGYSLKNTIFKNESEVNRGICEVIGSHLKYIEVYTRVTNHDKNIFGERYGEKVKLDGEEITCMNLFGFPARFMFWLDIYIKQISSRHSATSEITIHKLVNQLIDREFMRVGVILLSDYCYGLTFPQDKLHLNHYLASALD